MLFPQKKELGDFAFGMQSIPIVLKQEQFIKVPESATAINAITMSPPVAHPSQNKPSLCLRNANWLKQVNFCYKGVLRVEDD